MPVDLCHFFYFFFLKNDPGASFQVRPLLRLLRRHASLSLSLTAGGAMLLGGGFGSSVNSCAYFSSFRKAASALPSSSSHSRGPSSSGTGTSLPRQTKESDEEVAGKQEEREKHKTIPAESPCDTKNSTKPHARRHQSRQAGRSGGSAGSLEDQRGSSDHAHERTTKRPLKVS